MAIGTDVIGPTVLSSTDDVLLGGATWKVPSNVRTILTVRPIVSGVGVRTTAEAIAAKLKIESDDCKVAPYIVLPQPLGSTLDAGTGKGIGTSVIMPSVEYPINLPVSAGNEIKFYGSGLLNHTVEPYMMVVIKYSTDSVGPQYHAKIGTYTSTGTAAAAIATGTAYTITAGNKITKVFGYVVGTTVAEAKGFIGTFKLSSADFKVPWSIVYHHEPICGATDTDATTSCLGEVTSLAIIDVDIPINPYCVIQDSHTLTVAVTTAGKFITGVMYV